MIKGDMKYVVVTDPDLVMSYNITIDVQPYNSPYDDKYCYTGYVTIDGETFRGYITKTMFDQFGFEFI